MRTAEKPGRFTTPAPTLAPRTTPRLKPLHRPLPRMRNPDSRSTPSTPSLNLENRHRQRLPAAKTRQPSATRRREPLPLAPMTPSGMPTACPRTRLTSPALSPPIGL